MTSTRVNEIDLLRFMAALAVVFFHYAFRGHAADSMSIMPYPLLAPMAKYGYLGVQFFFMISGFVILMTAANGSLKSFFVSRVVRLYPAFWACCTLTFLVILAYGRPRYGASFAQYLVNMTMFSGFLGVPEIDGAYWSLFVELRFYALVATVLVIRKIHQAQAFLLGWLLASIAAQFQPSDALRYLLISDYSAFFIAGATCFLIWSKGLSLTRLAMVAGSWVFALYQSRAELHSFEKHYSTTMNSYVVAAIICTFFAVMMLVSLKRTGFFSERRWLLVGVVTYPLYLLHQKIGYIVFNAAYPMVDAHVLLWGTVLIVTLLAYAVHFFIEKKFSSPMKAALFALADRVQFLTRRFDTRLKSRF